MKLHDDGKTIGRWLTDGKRQLGIVIQRDLGHSFVCYYDDVAHVSSSPLFAISFGEDGKVYIQKRVGNETKINEINPSIVMDILDMLHKIGE